MGSKTNRPIIREDDLLLFKYLNLFKYVDMKFVFKHLYKGKSEKYIYRRIQQLEYNMYLKTEVVYEFKREFKNTTSRKILINDKAAHELLDINYENVQKIRDMHLHYVDHQIELANVIVNYYNAKFKIGENIIEVVDILTEREVSLVDVNIKIRPDSAIILSVNEVNVLVFIELEKSYSKIKNIKRKIKYQYNRVAEYVSKIDVINDYDIDSENIRVLFISENDNLKNNLIEKIKTLENIDIDLLFTTSDEIIKHCENSNILSLKYDTLNKDERYLFQEID